MATHKPRSFKDLVASLRSATDLRSKARIVDDFSRASSDLNSDTSADADQLDAKETQALLKKLLLEEVLSITDVMEWNTAQASDAAGAEEAERSSTGSAKPEAERSSTGSAKPNRKRSSAGLANPKRGGVHVGWRSGRLLAHALAAAREEPAPEPEPEARLSGGETRLSGGKSRLSGGRACRVQHRSPLDPMSRLRRRQQHDVSAEYAAATSLVEENAGIAACLEQIKQAQGRQAHKGDAEARRDSLHAARRCSIHPHSRGRRRWDSIMVVLVLASVWLVPLQVAFDDVFATPTWTILLSVPDLFFLADLCANFITGYHDDQQQIVTAPWLTARHYLRGWFAVDFASALPVDLLMLAAGEQDTTSGLYNRSIRLVRLTKILRMLKLADGRLVGNIELAEYFNPAATTMIKMIFVLLTTWHILACSYWAVASFSWGSAWSPDLRVRHATMAEQYLIAMYWSIGVSSALYYPETGEWQQTLFTMFALVLGLFLSGFLIGALASVVASLNLSKQEFNRKMEVVRLFLAYKKVPTSLRMSIISYYSFFWSSHQSLDEDTVLVDLPPTLRLHFDIEQTKRMFINISLFHFFPKEAILLLVQRMQVLLALPGELVIKQGDAGAGLFFITRGAADVIKNGEVVATMHGSEFFGERSLLTDNPVRATVRAATFCDLVLIEKNDVLQVLAENPELAEQILLLADKRDARGASVRSCTWRAPRGASMKA